jgi:hypothetical protein
MKRLFLAGVLAALAVFQMPAQSTAVVIENADAATFHYVLDPPELTAFDTGSVIFENVVYDYFAAAPAPEDDFSGFSELAPGESLRMENLAEGKHLLVGFFLVPGEIGVPVRVITLQVGGELAERTYRIFSEPALITARAGRGRISDYQPTRLEAASEAAAATATGPQPSAAPTEPRPTPGKGFFRFQIDNQYEDWEAIPVFLSFPPDRSLESFTREQYGGEFEVLPISRARHWGSDGTRINEVKVVNNLEAVYLYVSTHSALSGNLSIFLYFHTEQNLRRIGATNRFTLELLPAGAGEPGLVVLWEKERKPVIVGSLASGSFFLEAKIDKKLLYDIETARPEITFFDLTTSYYDRQDLAYEEFYIASIPLASIPTEQTLY